MKYVNARATRLKPSETLAVKSKAAELRARGVRVLDLSTGEPDSDTPEHIKEATRRALRDGKTKYTDVVGIKELREALAEKLRRENGILADPTTVVVTNGGKQALQSTFQVVLEPGDEVIVPAPYWVSYVPMIEIPGGTPVIVHAKREHGYKITPDQLQAAITPRTKAILFNSPSNPTGAGYSADELRAFTPVLASTNALIVSDEVYEKIAFTHFVWSSCAQVFTDLHHRLVTVNAFSKTYSMTGWRVGYVTGPKEIVSAIGRLQSQTTSNVCSIAQYGALAALTGPQEGVTAMVRDFERRTDSAMARLHAIPGLRVACKPQGAFYLFVDCSQLRVSSDSPHARDGTSLVNYLLDTAGVALVPGEAFGDAHAFRMSVAVADDVLNEGVSKIAEALATLTR